VTIVGLSIINSLPVIKRQTPTNKIHFSN